MSGILARPCHQNVHQSPPLDYVAETMMVNVNAKTKEARATSYHDTVYKPQSSIGGEIAGSRIAKNSIPDNQRDRAQAFRKSGYVKDERFASHSASSVYERYLVPGVTEIGEQPRRNKRQPVYRGWQLPDSYDLAPLK
jgi:hypothetical protein